MTAARASIYIYSNSIPHVTHHLSSDNASLITLPHACSRHYPSHCRRRPCRASALRRLVARSRDRPLRPLPRRVSRRFLYPSRRETKRGKMDCAFGGWRLGNGFRRPFCEVTGKPRGHTCCCCCCCCRRYCYYYYRFLEALLQAHTSLPSLTSLQTALGSSANYSATANFDHFDLLSSDAAKNPDFHDWTGVYVKCQCAAQRQWGESVTARAGIATAAATAALWRRRWCGRATSCILEDSEIWMR